MHDLHVIATLHYETSLSIIPVVRDEVRAAIGGAGFADGPRCSDLLVAVSEAVTNVVRHSGSASLGVDIRSASDELTVIVSDRGRGLGLVVDDMPSATATGGRGLPLMTALVDHCAVQSTRSGTRIELRQSLARRQPS